MSTRSTLTVRDQQDGQDAYSIYRHCDGYPDTEHGVFATLRQALTYAWPLPRFEARDFGAAIIAAWKQQGGTIYMTDGRDGHWDTEYHYEIWPGGNGRVAVQCFRPIGQNDKRDWCEYGPVQYLTAGMQASIPLARWLSGA